ncbi:unnamed protein product [Rhizophagus irregularis]|uniref:Uncharacterized protein n=3 Tax=Rhizophagus irregularis TaxID=588596 RepID=A0A015M322_RHIIW|nr:hypothetical protein RirG_173300 [Rhizophagus irregularis DAOM 197198w]UZO09245.1 hypothetical protein OCT59_029479 [Rhizophagus irregularis]GBC49013.1 hypothetical protein RIR_jg25512.t1 [Rhizophagus irregularis DAOM 181602=DAOM 197198]EXX61199.1 hypothetical protein RirG_173300 [Rhizophagus irregularis DAOM 197198w]CAB4409161.1 unnamed protein product [Rhizophagus irregularis]
MTGPYRSRKDRFNRDGKRPILIRDEKIENGVDFYLVECRNPNVAWHWRPRNKIWGWRRLYDEFLFSKRQRQERQIYANNNDIDVINPSPPSIRDDRVGISYFNDEKYHYEDHDRFPPKHYDDHNHYNNNYDNYDYIYQEDPKCYSGRSSSSSSSSSYKSENQFHSRAWGTSEYEEPSLTITRVRKQYSSNYNSYNSSLPSQLSHHHNHHDHHNLEINNSINQYYSPWENKHEFEIALNKLDRYYQDLFYSKRESL